MDVRISAWNFPRIKEMQNPAETQAEIKNKGYTALVPGEVVWIKQLSGAGAVFDMEVLYGNVK